jgi:hypothetical protein
MSINYQVFQIVNAPSSPTRIFVYNMQSREKVLLQLAKRSLGKASAHILECDPASSCESLRTIMH